VYDRHVPFHHPAEQVVERAKYPATQRVVAALKLLELLLVAA